MVIILLHNTHSCLQTIFTAAQCNNSSQPISNSNRPGCRPLQTRREGDGQVVVVVAAAAGAAVCSVRKPQKLPLHHHHSHYAMAANRLVWPGKLRIIIGIGIGKSLQLAHRKLKQKLKPAKLKQPKRSGEKRREWLKVGKEKKSKWTHDS